jgi:hypothetical protein
MSGVAVDDHSPIKDERLVDRDQVVPVVGPFDASGGEARPHQRRTDACPVFPFASVYTLVGGESSRLPCLKYHSQEA